MVKSTNSVIKMTWWCAWRNFKNIFSRPLFTIIFRPEMLKFHPYSIFTRDTMVWFVIFSVLMNNLDWSNHRNRKILLQEEFHPNSGCKHFLWGPHIRSGRHLRILHLHLVEFKRVAFYYSILEWNPFSWSIIMKW